MTSPNAAPPPGAATLTFDGKSVELPVLVGSEGEVAVNIEKLRSATGLITLDPGYGNTGSCRSAITFIDGDKGILRYRGYAIEELAVKSSFLEVAWLLLYGELPKRDEKDDFDDQVTHHTMLNKNFDRFFDALPEEAHPMPVLAAAVSLLATFYRESETPDEIHAAVIRLIAKMPTIAAQAYKHSVGQPIVQPRNRFDYASNFLHMMFATPCEEYIPDPTLSRALDLLLILHADHEQNCSASTVRMTGSSWAGLFASIASGIGSLSGPLHGGANQAVMEMLESIEREEGSAERFIARAKDRNDTSRLMGFGHRVYRNYDPRARLCKQACNSVIAKVGVSSKLLEIALELEEIALKDDYFISRKLYPNVDFYSGVIYRAMGIPTDMFPVMFAIGRTPGWLAQWLEMKRDPDTRIGRPRQVYTGANLRSYVSMAERQPAGRLASARVLAGAGRPGRARRAPAPRTGSRGTGRGAPTGRAKPRRGAGTARSGVRRRS